MARGVVTEAGDTVRRVVVRPCARREAGRFRELLQAHHYLGFRGVIGEWMSHVAEVDGEWVALILWAAAAFKCSVRDAWIGWHSAIAWQRLPLVANNVRFLILPGDRVPNLASRVLALSTRRVSGDWEERWGHPILLVETFVDPGRFFGTCYRAAGWVELGSTRGFARRSGGWTHHGHPKLVFVKELRRHSRRLLRDPGEYTIKGRGAAKMRRFRAEEIGSLFKALREIPDPRHRRGQRHSAPTILTIVIAAVLSGARSYAAIGQWAKGCTQKELRRLRCYYSIRKGRYEAPEESTIRRLLQGVDPDEVDRRVGEWLREQVWDDTEAIALDGKTVRGCRRKDGHQMHLLSAVVQGLGVTIAQREVDSKTNEIPAALELLEPLPLKGKLVTADALHTQRKTARFLVETKECDYCFTVKDNQRELKEEINTLFDAGSFPPSAHNDQ